MSKVENYQHVTVLLHEAVDALAIREDGIYVDGTFGRGGHSRLILSRLGEQGCLVVFDKDPEAIAVANELAAQDKRVRVVHNGFETFQTALDMRMDPTRGMSAAEWIATASEQDLHEVIKNYGEERFSRQIARAIVAQREESPIDTTRKLAQLVAQNVRTRERGQDPATRTFQAVRIFINRELEEVEAVLPQVAGRLKEGGRLAVIAFHSLEDRIVKQFIKKYSQHAPLPRWAVVKEADLPQPPLKAVGKAIKPGSAETEANPRARSAVLRVAERSSGEFSVVD